MFPNQKIVSERKNSPRNSQNTPWQNVLNLKVKFQHQQVAHSLFRLHISILRINLSQPLEKIKSIPSILTNLRLFLYVTSFHRKMSFFGSPSYTELFEYMDHGSEMLGIRTFRRKTGFHYNIFILDIPFISDRWYL